MKFGRSQLLRGGTALVFILTLFVALGFALYTNIAWDDWYITYRASRNMALGNGLTFTAGERIHSFTSPLGTLIPAFLRAYVSSNDDTVLWMFRIVSATMLGSAAALLLNFGRRLGLLNWSIFVLIGLLVFDAKIIINTVNGMESAFLVFFLTLCLYVFTLPQTLYTMLLLGLAWAGLMWSRPDGFVYIVGTCLGLFVFRPERYSETPRLKILGYWSTAAIVVIIVYGPWLLFAHIYYGTFIPHTIIAKGYLKSSTLFSHGLRSALYTFRINARGFLQARAFSMRALLIPPYGITFGGWPEPLVGLSRALAWSCSLVWVVPYVRRITRALSLAACVGLIYLAYGMEYPYPWYFPPVTLLIACVVALVVDQVMAGLELFRSEYPRFSRAAGAVRGAVAAVSGVLVGTTCVVTMATAVQLRAFQSVIYDKNYKQVGLFLRDNAKSPHDTVFLEPLGYIGFYSNLKMYDYPGLSSDEMIAARKTLPPTDIGDRAIFAQLIPLLSPDWLVLRPKEIDLITGQNPSLLTNSYRAVKTFDVTSEIQSQPFLLGRGWFALDKSFVVFHRNRPLVSVR